MSKPRRLEPTDLLLAAVGGALTDPHFQPGALIMAEVFQLTPRDAWQCTVEIVKKPDGKLCAVLVDARGSIINGERTPAEALSYVAHMLEESVAGMRATAQAVKS